jgi:hypothetical protein
VVPRDIAGWSYELISQLCAAGQSESDRHDFKFNLSELVNLPKVCCAFANTFGGFIIVGVKEADQRQFEIIGLDPDRELYSRFLAKVKVSPDVAIERPKTIAIPGSTKLLYVFEIPQSSRRPHLPTPPDQRVFWKRQGSDCVQMTLEEIRQQMNAYEEKREKLALLLIDLHNKLRSLNDQAAVPDGYYNGDVFTFDIIDRVLVETFAVLRSDVSVIHKLDTIKRRLMSLNTQKQTMLAIQAMAYNKLLKNKNVNAYRDAVVQATPEITILVQQVERTLEEKFGITNPFGP